MSNSAGAPSSTLRVAIGQIAPAVFDRAATLAKVVSAVEEAAAAGARLVAFGEALVPGYPVWLDRADGARFESAEQKALHARYATAAVQVERGDLDPICTVAGRHQIAVSLGIIERPADRGGKSLYCSSVYIDATGAVRSVHRKLMPTYEERLTWAPGDGHGLVTHSLEPFTVGALNCWENWMPLPRAALYAQGEDLHIAHWPGGVHNTQEITRFLAKEGRSFVLSASSVLRAEDFPADTPNRDAIVGSTAAGWICDGGSCIAGPDGAFCVEPVVGQETVLTADLEFGAVLRERQNFDPSGHYSRPDVTKLIVDRRRQGVAEFED